MQMQIGERERLHAAIAITIFGAAMMFAAPAMAAPAACITDAELDAAVGDQVRSGSFTINTSKLREAPMCSGLTVAQAIQKLAAGATPAAPRREPEPPRAPATTNTPAGVQALLPASTTSELLAYVGKYKFDKIKGRAFFDHPAVISALKNTGAPAAVRKNIADYHVSGPIERQGDILIENSCYPHSCDTMQYRVIVNAVTGAAAMCNLEKGADWYFGGRATPLNVNANCVIESLREAPIDVSRALPSQAAGATRAAAPSTNLPDITSFLTFYDPKMCSNEKWTDMFYTALNRKPVQIGALGQIKFRRSGPDKDQYITDSAIVNAK